LIMRSAPMARAERRKFERGPAADTTRFASLGLRVLPRFTGVGLADPKMSFPEDRIYMKSGRRTLPKGSRCRSGFRLIRPRSRAVVSPNFRADQACADSWKEIAKRMTASWIPKSTTLKAKESTLLNYIGLMDQIPQSLT
jgi:hypothetical protein